MDWPGTSATKRSPRASRTPNICAREGIRRELRSRLPPRPPSTDRPLARLPTQQNGGAQSRSYLHGTRRPNRLQARAAVKCHLRRYAAGHCLPSPPCGLRRNVGGDQAIVAADLLAEQDRCRLTIVVVVELEAPLRWVTRSPRGTSVWNDVLLDRARADLERAACLVEAPADLTVLFGAPHRAIPDGAKEFDCDAIMLPARPQRSLARLMSWHQAAAIRRRASCAVLQPR